MKTKKKSPARNRGSEVAMLMPPALKPVLFSLLFGTIAFAVVLMLFAFFMSIQDVPTMLYGPMSVAALVIGAILSGAVIGRFMRSSGLAYGALCGLLLYALIFCVSIGIGEPIGLQAIFKVIISMLSGAIGGIVGVNMRTHRRK